MTATRAPAVALQSVTSGYGQTTILRDIDLVVPAGSVTALLGPNGAGKSTLLKTVSGLLRPSKGTVELGGQDVTKLPTFRRTQLGLCHIPEGRGIFRSLTVRENLEQQAAAGSEAAAVEKATEIFPILGQRLDQRAGLLSGGQQQILAMARAYTTNPSLILVDEASLGLAPIVVDAIFEFLENIAAEGTALLIVDQFAARAMAMASRVHVLNRGELVFSGTPEELRDGDLFARYLGGE
jgi:branched-chain amino acid transport system ATP-binding protein